MKTIPSERTFLGKLLRTRTLRLALSLVVLLAFFGTALAASAATPAVDWQVLASSGGGATGGAVALDATLGQPITGVSGGSSAWLGAGYWYASQPVQLYLPLLRR